ncbi:hypothetical protein Pmani_038586 [Petrolisthes manimaculis]|uniref:Uncharacterized protein n=1 Tax=Petrolisthes manimaculis TaxID=1843537 RepID=A0AAE1TK50_9EUCA|nr:hypothetical protein Pmani_038586 [Petrolisthes manimaculis]
MALPYNMDLPYNTVYNTSRLGESTPSENRARARSCVSQRGHGSGHMSLPDDGPSAASPHQDTVEERRASGMEKERDGEGG